MSENPEIGSRLYSRFVRVEDGTPVALDNSPFRWRTDSGQRPTDEWLRVQDPAYYGWIETPKPLCKLAIEKIVEVPLANLTPNPSEGTVAQEWQVVSLTAEEIAQRETEAWSNLRFTRNVKLSDTDWIVVKSYETGEPVPQVWSDYRQALRDLPANTTDPFNPVWPQEPV